jgi:hypothetical protein
MAKVKYVGRHDAVEVELPLGGFAIVERGQDLETSHDHAASLLLAGIEWERVADEKPKAKDTGSGDVKK